MPHTEILEACLTKFLTVKAALKSAWMIGGVVVTLLIISVTFAFSISKQVTELQTSAISRAYVDSLMLSKMNQIISNQEIITNIRKGVAP